MLGIYGPSIGSIGLTSRRWMSARSTLIRISGRRITSGGTVIRSVSPLLVWEVVRPSYTGADDEVIPRLYCKSAISYISTTQAVIHRLNNV